MTDPIDQQISAIRALLQDVPTDDALASVERLSQAQQQLQAVLDESMALAVLAGHSMRTIGTAASLAPNSIPPRLARSAALQAYADPERGRVSLEGVARARYDHRTAVAPLRFEPRKRKGDER